MKFRKKSSVENESYWKSFTDIMAGLLLVILLVLMLLLLLLTQMNDEEHKDDYQYETTYVGEDDDEGDYDERYKHLYDHQYDNPDGGGGGGGGGGGVDDPGTKENDGIYVDVGHDKTAVFVTVIDEETGNVIKKDGILFELYANRNAAGGLMTLHTYYPTKVEYKQYKTTEDGTFFLPEKITQGNYSLHNLEAPTGYGLAKDVSFDLDEARDWSEPFLVNVPMAPAKSTIFIQNVDSVTNESVVGGVYEVYAAEDIVTLDGTVRYRNGEKVDEFTCDENGIGQSKQLYLGNYTVKQTAAPEFYALNRTPVSVTLDLSEGESKTNTVQCEKTSVEITLKDEYTEEPIKGAVYSVTGKEEFTTDANGKIEITDFDKNASYVITLESVPKPYRISEQPFSANVDGNGYIDNTATLKLDQTAYIIRLSVSIEDIIFRNSVTGNRIKLLDSADKVVEEWEATGSDYLIEGLEPGLYSLEINGTRSSSNIIDLKDVGNLQRLDTKMWTAWDSVSVVLAAAVLSLLIIIFVRIIRRFGKKKKSNE